MIRNLQTKLKVETLSSVSLMMCLFLIVISFNLATDYLHIIKQLTMDVSARADEINIQDQKSSSSLQRMMMLQEEEENDNDHRIMESEMNHFNGKSKSSIPSSMLLYREGSDKESIPVKNKEKKLKDMNKRKRVIQKNGLTNVSYKNISKKRRRYFNDLYTTLLDSSWNYCVLLFTASFFGSWMFFAILYYIIAYIHGDLDMGHLPSDGGDWMPCILEIDGFSAAFLFSLETQHTIGYGGRQTTTKCSDAIIIVSLQVRTSAELSP